MNGAEGAGEVLALLKENGVVSGARLSAKLGISRTALWKRINGLRRKGFSIDAVAGKGYVLKSAPAFSAEELRAALKGPLGRDAEFLTETASTNDLAMQRAAAGAPEGCLIAADSQSRGRGRLGRAWVSPPGCNIYMSIVLRPSLMLRDAPLLTVATAVACATAIREIAGVEATIKWPNDIMAGERKLGGVLVEARSEADRILYAASGVGINVNMTPEALPPDVRANATSLLALTGSVHERVPLMAAILDNLALELEGLAREGGAARLRKKWKSLCSTIGRRVRVVSAGETITGAALDIDPDWGLIVDTEGGGLRKLSSADVFMLR